MFLGFLGIEYFMLLLLLEGEEFCSLKKKGAREEPSVGPRGPHVCWLSGAFVYNCAEYCRLS